MFITFILFLFILFQSEFIAAPVAPPIDGDSGGCSFPVTLYRDLDGDGYGNPSNSMTSCSSVSGYVTNSFDCNDNSASINPNTLWFRDQDGDRYYGSTATQCTTPSGSGWSRAQPIYGSGDCIDTNAAINPGTTWYHDADGDGYHGATQTNCYNPGGIPSGSEWSTSTNGFDCNDNDAYYNPNTVWWNDGDSDGALAATPMSQCASPGATWVTPKPLAPTDCNDANPNIGDDAWYQDIDGDGFVWNTVFGTCSRPSGSSWYNVNEISLNGLGECNDNDASDTPDTEIYYRDVDGDGRGDVSTRLYCQKNPSTGVKEYIITNDAVSCPTSTAIGTTFLIDPYDSSNAGTKNKCSSASGFVSTGGDCDDSVAACVTDCSTQVYHDNDGDGYGHATRAVRACDAPGSDYVSNNQDCDDNNAGLNPNTVWYRDIDGDNYYSSTATQCTDPDGSNPSDWWTRNAGNGGGDCDDGNAAINPATNWYRDRDGDNYYSSTATQCATPSGSGWTTNPENGGSDCNDNNRNVYPGATEQCDGTDRDCDGGVHTDSGVTLTRSRSCSTNVGECTVGTETSTCSSSGSWGSYQGCTGTLPTTEVCDDRDNDCDATIDEGFDKVWYYDPDGDRYRGSNSYTLSCTSPGANYVHRPNLLSNSLDCNNNDASVHPGHPDSGFTVSSYDAAWCNGVDNDCDGLGAGAFPLTCYPDDDNDGWHSSADAYTLCSTSYNNAGACNPDANALYYTSNFDADDSNWHITYLSCGSNDFVYERVNSLTYSSSDLDAADYALNYKPASGTYTYNKFVGACMPNSNYCVTGNAYVNNEALDRDNSIARDVVASGSTITSNRVTMDQVAYCSTRCNAYGCEILDCDSDSNSCSNGCGLTWASPGASHNTIGEYDSRTRSECCGDDAGEFTVTQHCPGSTSAGSTPALCCPSSAYFINGDECVLECPDVMDTKPTWVAIASTADSLYQAYDASLDGTNGYCCDGSVDGSKPLCQAGRVGCYIQLDIANEGQGGKSFCDTTANDDFCVLEACLNGDTYEFCEQLTTCNEEFTVVPHVLGDDRDYCTSYSVDTELVENSYYAELPSGCSAANVNNCEAVSRQVCTGVNCNGVLCQRDASGDIINCQESCESYRCTTVVSYHGPYCTFDSGCEPTTIVQEEIETVDVTSVGSCSAYTVCNEFGCSCGPCNEFGCPACSEEFVKSQSCVEGESCSTASCSGSPLADNNLYCFDDMHVQGYNNNYGNELLVKVTGNSDLSDPYYQCDPTASIETGDPICQYGQEGEYNYVSSVNACETVRNICDQSAVSGGTVQSYTNNGCYDLGASPDDAWSLYDSDCVADTSVPGTYSNVYDAACCSAYTINSLGVYEEDTTNVVVY